MILEEAEAQAQKRHTPYWLYVQRNAGEMPTVSYQEGLDRYDVSSRVAGEHLMKTPYDEEALARHRPGERPDLPTPEEIDRLVLDLDRHMGVPGQDRPDDSVTQAAGALLNGGGALTPGNVATLQAVVGETGPRPNTVLDRRLNAIGVTLVRREIAGYDPEAPPEAAFETRINNYFDTRLKFADLAAPNEDNVGWYQGINARAFANANRTLSRQLGRLAEVTEALAEQQRTESGAVDGRVQAVRDYIDSLPEDRRPAERHEPRGAPGERLLMRFDQDGHDRSRANGELLARVEDFATCADTFKQAMSRGSPSYRATYAQLASAELIARAPTIRERLKEYNLFVPRTRRWMKDYHMSGFQNWKQDNPISRVARGMSVKREDRQLLDFWCSNRARNINGRPERLPAPAKARETVMERRDVRRSRSELSA